MASLLNPEFLLKAYAQGVFPMALDDGELGWFSPDPRGVIPLEAFHVPHGLARTLKKFPFEVRLNSAFPEVMRACAKREETWISEEIFRSYVLLYELGHAHSVETWLDGKLVGGLYGVALGGAFFGESMFHTVTDASKVALYALVARLRERGFSLLDIQWVTPHLATFGAVEIRRRDYLKLLNTAMKQPVRFVEKSTPDHPFLTQD